MSFPEQLAITYSRSSGPGGQHVNKGEFYKLLFRRKYKDSMSGHRLIALQGCVNCNILITLKCGESGNRGRN